MRSLLKKPLPAGYLCCILTIFVSFDAYACSCFPDMEFTKSLEKADSAFIGTHSGANRFLSLDTQRHKFRVDTIIKGATSDWVRIWSPKWTASCGLPPLKVRNIWCLFPNLRNQTKTTPTDVRQCQSNLFGEIGKISSRRI